MIRIAVAVSLFVPLAACAAAGEGVIRPAADVPPLAGSCEWYRENGALPPPGCRTAPATDAERKRFRADEEARQRRQEVWERAAAECEILAYQETQRVLAKPEYSRGGLLSQALFNPMLAKNEADAGAAHVRRLCMRAKGF